MSFSLLMNYLYDNACLASTTSILALVYLVYYKKYRRYVYLQDDDVKNPSKPRGKCPPFFPNGWYRLLNSDELKVNEVKSFNYCGRNVVLFRGTNNQVYALHAYCSHMGADLGKGGKVKNGKCIQCPFHGWIFDGETGNCVVTAESSAKKTVEQFEYNDIKHARKVDSAYLHKCYEGNVNLKKYHVKELNGSILIWYDSRPEFQDNYPYEPFDMQTKLEYRGESINFVNCHIQEIPENGADIRHFDFLHTKVFDYFSFIGFEWSMLSHRASEDDLFDVMKHKHQFINEFKMKTLKKFINEKNKKYVNVISLDCYLKIFSMKFFFFNATGFQVN